MKRLILGLIALVVLIPVVGLLGYYAHKHEFDPIHKNMLIVERKVETALKEFAGIERQSERELAQVESTFLDLKGTLYRKDEEDVMSGGAVATWGDDVLLMSRVGSVFRLEEGEGLVLTGLKLPDNGRLDYIAASKLEKYSEGYSHIPQFMRYNDIELVEAPALRGFALSYTFYDETRECFGSRVAWLPVPDDITRITDFTASPADWEVIFETEPCLPLGREFFALEGRMAGGRMAFKAPSTMYLGSGEYHLDGVYARDGGAGSWDSDYGKVIAIDLIDRTHRLVSKGHRNIQGITFDNDGRLWITEHGFRGGDELNLIKEGLDYGWPRETLGTLYNGQPAPIEGRYGRHDIYEPPIFAWLPSAAISSLTTITGIDESWDGDLLAGSLSNDVRGRSLWHIRIRDERVVFVERIELGRRIRDVRQVGENRIAVWMDGSDLAIFDVVRRKDQMADAMQAITAKHGEALSGRVMSVMTSCNECHSFQAGVHESAPSLIGMYERGIADTDYSGYSDALAGMSGIWTRERLKAFLTDPASFAPETSMPPSVLAGETDQALLDAIIDTLAELHVIDE